MAEIKHKGFGRWYVVDGERELAGPMTRSEAEAWPAASASVLLDSPGPAASAADAGGRIPRYHPDGRPMSELERRRFSERLLDRDQRSEADLKAAPFKALCEALWGPDDGGRMWAEIEPIVRSGTQGLRREMGRNRRSGGVASAA